VKRRLAIALVAIAWLVAALDAAAQAPNNASLRGRVLGPDGPLPGATVSVVNSRTGGRRQTLSDAGGRYAFGALPLTGRYDLTVEMPGFAAETTRGLELRSGETAVADVRLSLRGATDVTVFGTTEGVRADSPQLGLRLDQKTLERSPLLGRRMTSIVLLDSAVRPARGTGDLFLSNTLFVTNGGGRRQTTFVVDGSTNDDGYGRQTVFANVPLAALEEVTVLSSSFAAEYGRTSGGVVNMVTRAGTNDFHGELLALYRPGSLQARAPLATQETQDELLQGSLTASGPIVRDAAHAFVAVERSAQDRDAVVTSPLAPGIYTGEYRQSLGLARVDVTTSESNTVTGRFNFEKFDDTNPSDAVGGLALPSAGREYSRQASMFQLQDVLVLDGATLLEGRAQLQVGSPISQFEPVTPSTQYVRPGLGTEGESRAMRVTNRQWDGSLMATRTIGRHTLKAGGEAIRTSVDGDGQEFGGGFVLGQFTLKPGVTKPIASLTAADIQRYTQSFGSTTYAVREWLYAAFLRDTWTVVPNLTLDLGLRYDRQTLTDARNDVSPRLGFAWSPGGDPKTAVRGGFGLYYSEVRPNVVSSYVLGGPEGVFSFSATPSQYGFPSDLQPLPGFPEGAVRPARDITVRAGQRAYLSRFLDVSRLRGYPDELVNPESRLYSLGIERELPGRVIGSLDLVHQDARDFERTVDLNAPELLVRTQPGQVRPATAADATRPIPAVAGGYRRILVVLNDGSMKYDALRLNLRRQFSRGAFLLSWTWSHARNDFEPDVPGQDPNDVSQRGGPEWSDGLLDQRHRLVLNGWWQGPAEIVAGGVLTAASGRPYNVTTGVDNNGDGASTDRPVVDGAVIGRNAGRTDAVLDVDLFLQREFPIGGLRLTLRAEALNVFNHQNIVGVNAVYGNDPSGRPVATFGLPVGGIAGADPNRMFQFSARLAF